VPSKIRVSPFASWWISPTRHLSPAINDPTNAVLALDQKLARALLWTPEEAAAYLRKIGVDEGEVPTLERSAQNSWLWPCGRPKPSSASTAERMLTA